VKADNMDVGIRARREVQIPGRNPHARAAFMLSYEAQVQKWKSEIREAVSAGSEAEVR
jgi:hypothetical protein